MFPARKIPGRSKAGARLFQHMGGMLRRVLAPASRWVYGEAFSPLGANDLLDIRLGGFELRTFELVLPLAVAFVFREQPDPEGLALVVGGLTLHLLRTSTGVAGLRDEVAQLELHGLRAHRAMFPVVAQPEVEQGPSV